jgi:hypothetical protein
LAYSGFCTGTSGVMGSVVVDAVSLDVEISAMGDACAKDDAAGSGRGDDIG